MERSSASQGVGDSHPRAAVAPRGQSLLDIQPGTMKKEPQYSLLSSLSVVLLGLAILTVVPRQTSKPNLLGYHTLCAFVPISTLILLGLAGFVRAMRNTLYRRKP